MEIAYYFDYLSPYAYFSWLEIKSLKADYDINIFIHPIPYPILTNYWGSKGAATIPSKRTFVFKDAMRYSLKHNIPFNRPYAHPFKPFLSLRLSMLEIAKEQQFKIVDALWVGCWVNAIDMNDPQAINTYLKSKGIETEALLDEAMRDETKEIFKHSLDKAIAKGVFGVPTMIINDDLFWGRDQFSYIRDIIEGKDTLKEISKENQLPPDATWGI